MLRSCCVFLLAVVGLCCFAVPAFERAGRSVYAEEGSPATSQTDTMRTGYAGDAACLPCHKQQSSDYGRTAHHLTSQPPDQDSILGSFQDGSNILMIANPEPGSGNPRLSFKMERKEGSSYETALAELGSRKLTRSERIDVVLGSGVRGQTYLYWKGDQLYELPVSYWTDGHQWINSPGYQDGTANFAREIDPRCLECHTSYIRVLSPDPHTNHYDRASLRTGIACETCHGPGAEHVAREQAASTAHPESTAHTILNPARFDRDRQVDQCALCHNGVRDQELLPAFSYLPGKLLDQYLAPNSTDSLDHPDVHGNQAGLLKKSGCYLSSPTMTCSTCHNVHAPERSAASYSNLCLNCHRWQSCGVSKKLGVKITHNCVDCHMPLQQTDAIVSVTASNIVRTTIRSHWIKVYPNAEMPQAHP
jgi:hypothetical protein